MRSLSDTFPLLFPWRNTALRRLLARSWRGLALIVGLGVFAFLLYRVGIDTVFVALAGIGPAFLLMPALSLLGLAVRGLAILPLLQGEARFHWRAAVASRMAATALNLTIPAFGVGGEAARLLWVPERRRKEALSAIILDCALLVLADLIFLLLSVVAGMVWLALPARLEWLALAAALLAVALAVGLVWAVAQRGISARVVEALSKLGFKSMAAKLHHAHEVDGALRTLWRERPLCVVYATAIQLASRFFLAAEIWTGMWLLQVEARAVEALLVSAAPIGANALFTFIPGQLGVQEGSIGLVFGALGLQAHTGLVLGLLQRLGQLIQIPLGFVFLARAPRSRGKERPPGPTKDFG